MSYYDYVVLNIFKPAGMTRSGSEITGKTSTPGGRARYAYGFEDARNPDGWGAVGHGGGAPGMNGVLRIFPASGHVVAVLANLDPPAAQRAWMFVELRLER